MDANILRQQGAQSDGARDYGTIVPLCDVKGCVEPQSGDEVEIAVSPGLYVRVFPCLGHRGLLSP